MGGRHFKRIEVEHHLGGRQARLFNHNIAESGVGGHLNAISGIGHRGPGELLIPTDLNAAQGRNQGHFLGRVDRRIQVGSVELVAPSIDHTHGIPVTRAVLIGQGIGGSVRHIEQVVAPDAVEFLAAHIVDREFLWNGINRVAHKRGVHPCPRQHIAVQGKILRSAVIGLGFPCHGGNQGLVREKSAGKIIGKSRAGGPIDILGRVEVHARGIVHVIVTAVLNLLANLLPVLQRVGASHEIDVVACIVMTAIVIGDIAPPLCERAKGVGRVIGFPVELGRDVVDGALLEPRQRVAVNLVILPVAARGARNNAMGTCACAGCACHTSRTDAEFHIGLGLLHHVIHVLHHQVHIVAAPVGYGHVNIAVVPQVIVGCAAVGGRAVARIEVVVKDDAVDLVVLDDLLAHLEQMLARTLKARIEHHPTAHLHEQA